MKTILITGGSDGIGAQAARDFTARGHEVIIVGRSPKKTQSLARELGADYFVTDFTELKQVKKLAQQINQRYARLDVLINNAGGVFGEFTKTVDGFEKTFQINHLAPFLLTNLLLPLLLKTHATVIQTSSTVRTSGQLDIDDLNFEKNYSPTRAYGIVKLENILFTKELARRYGDLRVASFYPGNVATSFGSNTTSKLIKFLATNTITRSMLLTPKQGADTMVYLAENENWENGAYFYKRQAVVPKNKQAVDAGLAQKLWDKSYEFLADYLD